MNKIYSAIDADEATEWIGKRGYFGNTKKGIEDNQYTEILLDIFSGDHKYRFLVETKKTKKGYIYFQPIIETWRPCNTFEEALQFKGVWMRRKDNHKVIVFVSQIGKHNDSFLLINNMTADFLFDNYETLDGQPIGVLE